MQVSEYDVVMEKLKINSKSAEPGNILPQPPEPRSEEEIVSQWKGDISKPLVSVQCITYNHALYIEDAIKGFLLQETDFPIEVWIHDDASTDGTREIIEDYQKRYPRIIKTILQIENQYSKGNKPRHILSDKCTGKYIALCEGDDFWCLPEKLQTQANFLESNPDYSCCFHGFFWVNDSRVVKSIFSPNKGNIVFSSQDMLFLKVKKNSVRRTLTIMFVATHSRPPEAKMIINGDWFLYSTLGLIGKGMYLSGLNAAVFREHNGGVWSSRDKLSRQIERIKTFLYLAQFHRRVGSVEASIHFEYKAVLQVFNATSRPFLSLFFVFKNFSRKFIIDRLRRFETIKKIYQYLKNA